VATAASVKSIASIDQFKNLDGTCIAGGSPLKARFQVLENPNLDPNTKDHTLSQIEDDKNVHPYRYCNQVLDESFLSRNEVLQASWSTNRVSLVLPSPLAPDTTSAR
jgi:hypothetical protein